VSTRKPSGRPSEKGTAHPIDQCHDLQIFIDRTPSEVPRSPEVADQAEGPPAVAARDVRFRDFIPTQEHQEQQQGSVIASRYITIANSEVVEAFEFPFSNDEVRKFIYSLAANKAHLNDCTDFGAALFDALFRRSIRDLYRDLVKSAESSGATFRLAIATAVPSLMIVPWELLCLSRTGALPHFLIYNPQTYLTRSLRLFDRARFSAMSLGNEELRILLVSANAIRDKPIDVATEEQMLRYVVEETPHLGGVQFQHLRDASVNKLRRALADFQPNIVHFACHGIYARDEGGGMLALAAEDDPNAVDPIDAYRFAILMREIDTINLVFLNTCHGARQGPDGVFSGLAQCLHANDIPAVVALQYVLLDKTAHAVVLNFYRYLLRDRLSVEESVSLVRRHLFLNRYPLQECFGMALYQGNATLSWMSGQPPSKEGRIDRQDFSQVVNAFQEAQQQVLLKKVSSELAKIRGLLMGLESLDPADVLLMIHIFGDASIATDILRRLAGSGVHASILLPLVRLALVLCQTRHEQEEVVTGLLLLPATDPDQYLRDHTELISEALPVGFYEDSTRQILAEAIKVDAEHRTFGLVVPRGGTAPVREVILSLPQSSKEQPSELESYGEPRWRALAGMTQTEGVALLLPGGARIKILAQGAQVAEYREGQWNTFDSADFVAKVGILAESTGSGRALLLSILGKAFLAAELGKGRSFVLQGKDDVLSHCHAGYKSGAELSGELAAKSVADINDSHFLKLVEGDNAVVLSHDGKVLAINAALAPNSATIVQRLPGTGSRHLAAQKLTKDLDCIAVVVSDDGPVTIFFGGEVVVRRL